MKIEKNEKDLMTPIERKKAIQNGKKNGTGRENCI